MKYFEDFLKTSIEFAFYIKETENCRSNQIILESSDYGMKCPEIVVNLGLYRASKLIKVYGRRI